MGKRKGNEEVVIVIGQGMSSGNYGSLAKTIQDELQSLGIEVDDETQAVFDEVGKEAVKKLKATSPVNENSPQKGRYAKGWTYEKGKRYRGKAVGVVRNKKDPQLTHLLEYGHPIVRNGEVVGYAEAKEHIRPVADWVADEIETRLSKKIGGN